MSPSLVAPRRTPQVAEEVEFNQEDHDRFLEEIQVIKDNLALSEFPIECTSGTMKNYMQYGMNTSYSKPEYHFATLLAIASMGICRRVLILIGNTEARCNVYVYVIGATSISGKSAACDVGIRNIAPSVLYEEPIARNNGVSIHRGTLSAPGVVQIMDIEEGVRHQLWHYDDCGSFFDDASGWNSPIMQELNRLYDGSSVERRLSSRGGHKNHWKCPNPYLSCLFNCTPSDIENAITSKMFKGGFLARPMYIWGIGGIPRENEDVSESDKKLLGGVIEDIKMLKDDLYDLPDDSIKFGVCKLIEKWKIDTTMKHLGAEEEHVRIAIARGFIHAYKIATIFALMDKEFRRYALEHKDDGVLLKIPDKYAMDALTIVETYLIPRTMAVFDLMSLNTVRNHQEIVKRSIVSNGGVATKSKLLRNTGLNSKELDVAIYALTEAEVIKVKYEKETPTASKATMFLILSGAS